MDPTATVQQPTKALYLVQCLDFLGKRFCELDKKFKAVSASTLDYLKALNKILSLKHFIVNILSKNVGKRLKLKSFPLATLS